MLNFIGTIAESLPFVAESSDWVDMRLTLGHVQASDLLLLEAWCVLNSASRMLIGLYVLAGKSGVISFNKRVKVHVKTGWGYLG